MIYRMLRQRITEGRLILRDENGEEHHFGEGQPEASMTLNQPGVLRRIVRYPALELGQSYVDGDWDTPDPVVLLNVLRRNFASEAGSVWLRRLQSVLKLGNSRRRSRRNVAVHYDLDEPLFRAFLDREMHYSCAYFTDPEVTLEAAQEAKAGLIARKLCLEPGQQVLDIGCGWGSLSMYLAANHGVRVTGLTLSAEQHRVAVAEARRRGLSDQVEFLLEDYREHRRSYDRVVSVGMFEHVGRAAYGTFFDVVRERLQPGGVCLLHTIGRPGPPVHLTNPWIDRHIFPGGYIPSASEVIGPIESSRLVLCDLEIWRRHYAYTLHHWQQRFQARRDEFVRSKGERFCRIWEFYLAASESAFDCGELEVFHFQLGRDQDAVPLTRDYLYGNVGEGAWGRSEHAPRMSDSRSAS
ncbi:MAG: class I SAM-dependent methyltransferase [Gammaproteobacteria bacterium]|nr:MAG: class I SAM-dependent methyltransferase [Gammaproteobacteria bacterium]